MDFCLNWYYIGMFWSSIPMSSLVVLEILVWELSLFDIGSDVLFFPLGKSPAAAAWRIFRAFQGQTLKVRSLYWVLGSNRSVVFGAEADFADPALSVIPAPLDHWHLDQRLWQFIPLLSFVSFLLKFPWNLSYCLQGHCPTQRGW